VLAHQVAVEKVRTSRAPHARIRAPHARIRSPPCLPPCAPPVRRTAAKYRELYDEDLREAVRGDTSGDYGRLLNMALASPEEYVIEMISSACGGIGCNETTLIELCVTRSNEVITAGKEAWEAREDKSLVDYLDKELGVLYRHVQKLIFKLLKGERDEGDEVDEDKAAEQVEALAKECKKGRFANFSEKKVIEILATNNPTQNAKVAELFENEHGKSLGKALAKKCGEKLTLALKALLLPKPAFIATRLKAAMKGLGTDEGSLVRLLAGLDNTDMAELTETYESKYGKPLAVALKKEISGDFKRAALMWIDALQDPSQGLEATTEQEVGDISGDAEALGGMLDALLEEHGHLLRFVAMIDAENLASACKGFGTDDKALITTITSRSKAHLGRVSQAYYAMHEKKLERLVVSETSGWYRYLARFIVLSEAESDIRLLDLAMEGLGTNEAALIEFLCARPPTRVRTAKAAWEARHDESLVDKLDSELSGDFQNLCLTMLKGQRCMDDADDEAVDEALAEEQAQHLYDKGAGQWGTQEEAFIELLCSHSPAQNKVRARVFARAACPARPWCHPPDAASAHVTGHCVGI